MKNEHKTPKIFFGWWTVLACGVTGFLGVGFSGMAFSVLFKPIAESLDLSRAMTSIASGIQNAMGGILGPPGGWASDKYGPRRVMLLGIVILALGCTMMFFINSTWSFLFVWGIVVGAGLQLSSTIITDRAIVNWFVKKSGIALNTKFAIQGSAGLLLLPAVAWLVSNQGWRMTCCIAGIVILLVTIPLIWFFVKPHRPEYYGLKADGMINLPRSNHPLNNRIDDSIQSEVADLTLKQTTKTSAYWLLLVIQYVSSFTMAMMFTHLIPFLTDRKIDPIQAASMMGLMITIGIPIRLVAGFIIDRLNTVNLRFALATGFFVQAIGPAVFLLNESVATIYAWIFLYSIGTGISQSVGLPLQARYFGRKAFGSIMGLNAALQLPIGLGGPIFIGWVFDTSGSYFSVIVLMTIALAVSGVISCFIRYPKLRSQALLTPKSG